MTKLVKDRVGADAMPGRAASALANEIITTQPVLRALSLAAGLHHPAGGGVWSLLSILANNGPMTIKEAAVVRGVSRQYMIRLATQLESDGVVTLERNSENRGFQLHLTAKGEVALMDTSERFARYLAERTADMDQEDIVTAIRVVRDLRGRLKE